MGSSIEQLAKTFLRRKSDEAAPPLPSDLEELASPTSPRSPALRWEEEVARAGTSGLERPPPLQRYVPSLQVPQNVLVGYLTGGYSFDDNSVADALAQANCHFAKRELEQAVDVYGAAYELGRLNYDYRPLMHDLLLRRVLCHSMLGNFKKGLQECDMALKIIPNSATANLLKGLLYSKLVSTDAANDCFQRAVTQNRELRDVIDCLIGLFMMGHGENDRAIQICNRVLDRCRHPFALVVRGDAYKSHASGYFVDKATADYAAVLAYDIGAQGYLGERFSKELHARADELLLRFHPRLLAEGPRPYAKYSCYMKSQPFLVVALVIYAVGKLRAWVRSTKLVKHVEMQNEELLRQRAAAEHRMMKLYEAQSKLAGGDAHAEVWGPANPDLRVRRYRRYWMERPLNFPRRDDSVTPRTGDPEACQNPEGTAQSDREGTVGARDELFDRIDQDRDGVISREEFNRFVLEAKAPVPALRSVPPLAERSEVLEAAASISRYAAESDDTVLWPNSLLAARLKATSALEAAAGRAVGAGLQAASPAEAAAPSPRKPLGAGAATASTTPASGMPVAAAAVPAPRVPAAATQESRELAEAPESPYLDEPPERLETGRTVRDTEGAVDNLVAARQRGSSAASGPPASAAKQGSGVTEALEVAAKLARSLAPSVVAATQPKLKTGHDWSEEQWLQRALQLADEFRLGGRGSDDHKDGKRAMASITPKPGTQKVERPKPRPLPEPEPPVPPTKTLLMLPVAGPPGRTTSIVSTGGSSIGSRRGSLDPGPSSADSDAPCMPDDDPGFVGVHMPGLPAGQKVAVNLVEAMEQYGFGVLPNWYDTLDKIYELTDMAPYMGEAEAAVPLPGLTGAPGFSYVVPKSPAPETLACSKRYRGRLVATSLPSSARGPRPRGSGAANRVDPPPEPETGEPSEGMRCEPPRYRL